MMFPRLLDDVLMICLVFWGCASYKNVLLAASRSTFSLFSLFFYHFSLSLPLVSLRHQKCVKNHQTIVKQIVKQSPTNHQKVMIFHEMGPERSSRPLDTTILHSFLRRIRCKQRKNKEPTTKIKKLEKVRKS